jgi:two-component system nitrate/nitrite response regulator NarL
MRMAMHGDNRSGLFEPLGDLQRLTSGGLPHPIEAWTGVEAGLPRRAPGQVTCDTRVMDQPRQISIVVADDHPIVLCGVVGLLRSRPEMNVLATCSTGADALKAVRELTPDIAVLDVSMPDLDGLAVLSSLGKSARTRVILLTATATDAQLATAIACGARGVVLKDGALDCLLTCIGEVAAGGHWLPASLVPDPLTRETLRSSRTASGNQTLTLRQRQVMTLVSEGLSNKQVGRRLNLTEGTIKIHLHNIYSKIGVSNRTALAALAIDQRAQFAL